MLGNYLIDINNLSQEKDIDKFIEKRISKLNENAKYKEDIIDKTSKYLVMNSEIKEKAFYKTLIYNIKNHEAFNLVDLFNEIYYNTNDCFQINRNLDNAKERAVLTHNSFKFLGFDSKYIAGSIREENEEKKEHYYNCIFPMGYEAKDLIFLYDHSYSIDFYTKKNVKKIPAYVDITSCDYKNLSKKETSINFDKTAIMISKLVNKTNKIIDINMPNNDALYSIGTNKPLLRVIK